MIRKNTPIVLLALALASSGCAGAELAPMDPSRPIDTKDGYAQDGKRLDPDSMSDHLEAEPASAPAVARSKTLAVVSLILASAGGALIGWPLGQKLGGKEEPIWPLAYAGLGVVAISVPLGVWSATSMRSAVDAHNRRFGPDED